MNNAAGYVALKGGRFVALASGLLQIAKHIDISSINKKESVDDINKKESVDDMDKFIHETVEKTLE